MALFGRTTLLGLLILACCLGIPCAPSWAAEAGQVSPATLTITGSSTMCPMISAVAERFRALHPQIRVNVECGGSKRGISDVREGKADIGMVSRALTDAERDLTGFPMARDGVSVIVNRANPVRSLTDDQLRDIFTGRITNWRQVGGPPSTLTVIWRPLDLPVSELFTGYLGIKGGTVGKVLPGDNPVTYQAVAENRYAVSYLSSGEADRQFKAGTAVRPLPLNGIMPTDRNIITGNYPVTRALSLVTRGLPTGAAKTFIEYCLSSSVVDLIQKHDFVPYED